jgi:hypothetical protein
MFKFVPDRREATPMLTPATPTVKLQTSATPEQRRCATAIDQSLSTFWTLVERLRDADHHRPIPQV